MAQYGLPISDINKTNWAEGAGDGDGDSFDEIDEGFGAGRGSGSGPDDATTYWLTTDEVSNNLRHNVTSIDDPFSSMDHFVRVRCAKNSSAGKQLDLTFVLNEPNNVFTDSTNTDISNTWTTYSHELTTGEADSITPDYTTLSITVLILETGGGAPRVGWCSAQEFECPDAAGGGGGFAHSQGVIVG